MFNFTLACVLHMHCVTLNAPALVDAMQKTGFFDSVESYEFEDRNAKQQSELIKTLVQQHQCKKSDILFVLCGAHVWFAETDFPFVVMQLEQCSTPHFSPHYIQKMREARSVWDYSPLNIAWLAKKYNITCHHVPLLAKCDNQLKTEKTVDILFAGAPNVRRENFLVATENSMVTEKKTFVTRFFVKDHRQYAAQLASAKIGFNVHYYSRSVLEIARIALLVANDVLVISERSDDKILDALFDDVLIFVDSPTEMAKSAMFFLENEQKRLQKTAHAKANMKKKVDLSHQMMMSLFKVIK